MNKINPDTKIQLDPDLLYSKVGDEIVLLSLESDKYFKIDAIGSRILELLKQAMTFEELCEQLTHEFDANAEQIRKDTEAFLHRCFEDKLILVEESQ
jgi:hypothetical protein